MDREFKIRFRLSDVFKALVMSPILVVLIFWVLSWPWSSTNAPAWVQAVGSVAAIAVAIWLAERGHTRDHINAEKASLVEEARVAWLAECALYEAFVAIQSLHFQVEQVVTAQADSVNVARVEQVGAILRGVLQQQLPHRTVNSVFGGLAITAEVHTTVSSWTTMSHLHDWRGYLKGHASMIASYRLTVEGEYQRLANLAGIPFTQRVVQ